MTLQARYFRYNSNTNDYYFDVNRVHMAYFSHWVVHIKKSEKKEQKLDEKKDISSGGFGAALTRN